MSNCVALLIYRKRFSSLADLYLICYICYYFCFKRYKYNRVDNSVFHNRSRNRDFHYIVCATKVNIRNASFACTHRQKCFPVPIVCIHRISCAVRCNVSRRQKAIVFTFFLQNLSLIRGSEFIGSKPCELRYFCY